ncbi:hypothetical protein EW146_g4714 [Bondarzewia mesenterica]|uniref:Reverse transcriptase Ty1/copia-type domain-containing protein n=1 Tax=Bondarzewia mesenterica TaxID=1095465 RepID=A0A4S4LUQ7_9AGAM|nr:hypothetical protein EW146_g4714 [Bondarzewia mesenterica]
MDVKNAYLNGHLKEDIFMEQPPGFIAPGAALKYQRLCEVFIKLSFTHCSVDHGVFYKHVGKDILVIATSIDDLALFASVLHLLEWLKGELSEVFEMTNLREIHWLLGMEIKRDHKVCTISLSHNTARYHARCVASGTVHAEPWEDALGGDQADLEVPEGTREYWLVFRGTKAGLEGYTDSDWALQEHRHSISGYVFLYNGGAISWSLKKQPIITLSSTEAEYVAATHAVKEAIWLQSFLCDIFDIPKSKALPVTLHCDNQSAIALACDNTFHARTKHINIRFHFIREAVENGKIAIFYCPIEDMAADLFMKALSRPKVEKFVELIGLQAI